MKLLWVDLETTGLDERADKILEIAVAEADFEDPYNARHIYHAVLGYTRDEQDPINPIVLEMHTKNGLFAECAKSDTYLFQVERDLLALIPEVADSQERSVLAGSTIAFDHAFIRYQMRTLNKRLHYRNFDVSSVKMFCRHLGMEKIPRAEAHRAKQDIDESIAHGQACAAFIVRLTRG